MRRLVIVLALAGLMLAPIAAAHAQRDPFAPAIDTGGVTTGTEQPGTGAEPQPQPAQVGREVLADTGADIGPWFALAYALIAVGAGVLVAVRLRQVPARPAQTGKTGPV